MPVYEEWSLLAYFIDNVASIHQVDVGDSEVQTEQLCNFIESSQALLNAALLGEHCK